MLHNYAIVCVFFFLPSFFLLCFCLTLANLMSMYAVFVSHVVLLSFQIVLLYSCYCKYIYIYLFIFCTVYILFFSMSNRISSTTLQSDGSKSFLDHFVQLRCVAPEASGLTRSTCYASTSALLTATRAWDVCGTSGDLRGARSVHFKLAPQGNCAWKRDFWLIHPHPAIVRGILHNHTSED